MTTTTQYWAKKAILAAIEATPGTDATPTNVNGFDARNVQFTPLDAAYVENNIEVPWFGNSPELPVASAAKLSFDIALQGPGTAGQASTYGPLLRACGLAERLFAAPVTGTAQAGGASTITLAAGASAVDNAYQGAYLTLTGGTGSGQAGFVLSYNGTTKVATMVSAWTTPPDATSQYSIGAQAVYAPVSEDFESLSIYVHLDGVRQKLLYSRGNVKVKLTPKGLLLASFDFTSLYAAPTDETLPKPVLSGFQKPAPVNNDNTYPGRLHGRDVLFYDFQADLGHKPFHLDDVVGEESVEMEGRSPSGSITIKSGLMAEKNWYEAARLADLGEMSVTHGKTAGKRLRLCMPSTQVKSPKPTNKRNVVGLDMALRPNWTNGNDEMFFVFD